MNALLLLQLASLTLATPAGADTLLSSYQVGALTVIQQIDTSTPLVEVQLYLLGGTQILRPRTAGVEALFLGASRLGTLRYPGASGTRTLARAGAFAFSSPGWDWSVVGFESLAPDFDSAFAVLADRLAHPILADSSIDDARAELMAAARARELDPEERVRSIVESTFLAGHPYALDPRGTTSTLPQLTPEELHHFATEYMVLSRMLLVVVGNVSKAQVIAAVRAGLNQVPDGTYKWALPPPLPERDKQAQWIVQHRELPTTYLLGYCPAPAATAAMYWPFRLFTDIYSGWLDGEIRGHGLSYSARATYVDRARPAGGFQISTPAPDRAYRMAMEQMEDFGYIGAEEPDEVAAWEMMLKKETSYYRFGMTEDQSTVSGRAEVLARAQLLLGDYRKVSDLVPKTNWFNEESLREAAAYCHNTIELAFLGDTTRMHGAW